MKQKLLPPENQSCTACAAHNCVLSFEESEEPPQALHTHPYSDAMRAALLVLADPQKAAQTSAALN